MAKKTTAKAKATVTDASSAETLRALIRAHQAVLKVLREALGKLEPKRKREKPMTDAERAELRALNDEAARRAGSRWHDSPGRGFG